MILEGPVTSPGAGTPQHSHLEGQVGVALTSLRPAGLARIGDERLSVVALGGLIEEDTPITVVSVEGTEIRVRPQGDSPVRSVQPEAGSA
jgi:membrane-bound ClpP family serine protease